jgi:hypothetical protein
MLRLAAPLLFALAIPGCVAYEFEHEFWLRVDGSGTVNVTGRPELWRVFKGLDSGRAPDDDGAALREAARALFQASGLRVRRVTLTRRDGRPYLFVSADFDDVNALDGTPAFRDLRIGLRHEDGRLVLEGGWAAPPGGFPAAPVDRDGLMAVRFHLPSRVYAHNNAYAGVERGNIVGWRQGVGRGLDGTGLDFGATMDDRSILASTLGLFATAVGGAVLIISATLYLVARRGRRSMAAAAEADGSG